ncbi:MAG: hypothetical protein IPM29_13230 [Planctomycetes bacterium]|nr:hypothetical protein [Planctomycetota bacterium]
MTRHSCWNENAVDGDFVERDGRTWYRIRNVDRMPPFLTSIASSADHWLFASSLGPVTAGRRSPSAALFPYSTDDRLHDAVDRTGGRTIVHVDGAKGAPWEPGSERGPGLRPISRDLWKDVCGAALCFEEHERELGLTLRTTWTSSPRYGVVRIVELENRGGERRALRVIDGLLNLLPADVDPGMQTGFSNLVDAYKAAWLIGEHGLAVFALSSVPVDRAEPSEALRATTVQCLGVAEARYLLSGRQLDAALRGAATTTERAARGVRSAYLVDHTVELGPGESARWSFALEVEQDAAAIRRAAARLARGETSFVTVAADVEVGRRMLVELIAAADGQQHTSEPGADARHHSNTLFNVMRGGTFPAGHRQERADLLAWLAEVAPQVHARWAEQIAGWPERAAVDDFGHLARELGDADLIRLQREYLPLALSRRHGDPSRPWNTFEIRGRSADGSLQLGYQGNWRDIFQNWEALAVSFPAYAVGFVCRFVDASTADGYNPYRLMRGGVDWEVHDPADPWSFIGYWGDHQIAYLARLIERCESLTPGRLATLLGRREFVSVDVPYRIRPYRELVADPQDTVVFDTARDAELRERAATTGAEGKLVRTRDGAVLRMTLAEKLLLPFLVKLTNFVPGAGVWMNTQRPEWNDANNALVGRGASIVTTCALWQHAGLLAELFAQAPALELHDASARLLAAVRAVLEGCDPDAVTLDPVARRRVLDAVGTAGDEHRSAVYAGEFGAVGEHATADVVAFLVRARDLLGCTIAVNRGDDGLYHAYNLLRFAGAERIDIRRLPTMLEGQVAVLGCGYLDGAASATLLRALAASPLYCARRDSFLLYPDRELTPFFERNVLPADLAVRYPAAARLVHRLLTARNLDIVRVDDDGTLRFAPGMRNAAGLANALDRLAADGGEPLGEAARTELLAAYEAVFDHAAFTGRSGTFFGYEGLGCVYWHMVSKLALVIQEVLWRHVDAGGDVGVRDELRDAYRRVRRGLGAQATPADWGAFPIDAYSHTPGHGGAKQPGMTGQVKEDLLCRLAEVGVRIVDGRIGFDPLLLNGDVAEFTLCGTPIGIRTGSAVDEVVVTAAAGRELRGAGRWLDRDVSAAILGRAGDVRRVDVSLARERARAQPPSSSSAS